MRYVLLHYHILKNAGSTIEEALDHSFGHRFARFDRDARNATITPAELLAFVEAQPELLAVSSHHIRYPLPEAPDILFFDTCFLRDPLDRVRSLYDYYRDKPDPGDPVSELANRSEIGDFVTGMVRDFPLQIRNVQVNLIAAAGDSDEPTTSDLDIATERMLAASFPGVVDSFDSSARAGEYFLRQVFPELDLNIGPVNVSGGLGGTLPSRIAGLRAACHPAVFEELTRLNQLDLELVARTRAEVQRRAALVPAVQRPLRQPLSVGQLSDIFDAAFYLSRNPDVAAAGADPLHHYLKYGAAEGRKPNPSCEDGGWHRLFDPDAGGTLVDVIQRAPRVAADPAVMIDDIPLSLSQPEPHQRRFLQAANPDQLAAQMRFQKASAKG